MSALLRARVCLLVRVGAWVTTVRVYGFSCATVYMEVYIYIYVQRAYVQPMRTLTRLHVVHVQSARRVSTATTVVEPVVVAS